LHQRVREVHYYRQDPLVLQDQLRPADPAVLKIPPDPADPETLPVLMVLVHRSLQEDQLTPPDRDHRWVRPVPVVRRVLSRQFRLYFPRVRDFLRVPLHQEILQGQLGLLGLVHRRGPLGQPALPPLRHPQRRSVPEIRQVLVPRWSPLVLRALQVLTDQLVPLVQVIPLFPEILKDQWVLLGR